MVESRVIIDQTNTQEEEQMTKKKYCAIRLDPAKVAEMASFQACIIEDGDRFIASALSERAVADIERRTELFYVLTKYFPCEVGMVSH